MKNKPKHITKITALTLAFLFALNFCDFSFINALLGKITASADVPEMNPTTVNNLWTSDRADFNIDSNNNPTTAFWKDTSTTPAVFIDDSKVDIINPYNPDDYNSDDDKALHDTSYDIANFGYCIKFDTSKDISEYTKTDKAVADYSFKSNYKNEAYVKPDGTATSYTAYFDFVGKPAEELYYTIEYDETFNLFYRRYFVSTANQLQYLLYMYHCYYYCFAAYKKPTEGSDTSDTGGTFTAKEDILRAFYAGDNEMLGKIDSRYTFAAKLAITLINDIDLGGANDQYWMGYDSRRNNPQIYTLEIDGAGHNIYNGKYASFSNTAVLYKESTSDHVVSDAVAATTCSTFLKYDTGKQYAYISNVNFSNNFIATDGGIFGKSAQYIFLDNVNFLSCAAAKGSKSASIVFGNGYLYVYVNNCMARDCVIYGDSHCGIFASYNGSQDTFKSYSYVGDETSGASSYYFTDMPTKEQAEYIWTNYNSRKYNTDGEGAVTMASDGAYAFCSIYPTIYKNSMSIDCSVYDKGSEHSGTFVSCLQGGIIFKNCFSNSTIYAQAKVGVFTGCCIGSSNGFYYDYEYINADKTVSKRKVFVNSVFEDCFTSGLVEASSASGGFVGGIFNDTRAYNNSSNNKRGRVLFKNCYSTSLVGMQYTVKDISTRKLGGFAGEVIANYWGGTSGETQSNYDGKGHLFINCYAAGEVGGIFTNNGLAEDNNNTVGGFFGYYDTLSSETVTADKFVKPDVRNCFYDKQTTAMRERDIGGYNSVTGEPLHGSLSRDGSSTLDKGLQGVYTLTSTQKDVYGLADSDFIMDTVTDISLSDITVDAFDDGSWHYSLGYYPMLTAFTELDAVENFGDKWNIAHLYAYASTATVFLNHWDQTMNEKGEIVDCYDKTVYDTVRNITSDFEFTSGGNSDEGNLGWEPNEEKNEQHSYTDYLGGMYSDKTPIGIDVDYTYNEKADDSSTNATVIKRFSPEVINLTAEEGITGDYTFKCYDFAEGKQFVKVTTCDSDQYVLWSQQEDAYTKYLADLAEFNTKRSQYVTIAKVEGTTATDEEINTNLISEVKTILNTASDISLEELTELVKTVNSLSTEYLTTEFASEEERKAKQAELNIYFNLDTSLETFEADFLSLAEIFEIISLFPFVAPTEVISPTNFNDIIQQNGGEHGTRTIRLVPRAYLDSGEMITVNVNQNTSTGAYSNTVNMNLGGTAVTMDKFDHTLGVLYSSTQGLATTGYDGESGTNHGDMTSRLGDTAYFTYKNTADETDNTIYQKVSKNSTDYYITDSVYNQKIFDNARLNTDNVFGLYDYFPSRKEAALDGTDAKSPFEGLVSQILLGHFYPLVNGKNTGGGKTMVKVYKTNMAALDSTGTNYDLVKGDVLAMSSGTAEGADNLSKWSGETPFETSDKGYYYMVYYWKLDDGRYLEETKLVYITANQFTVDMRTGVMGDTEDTFVYRSYTTDDGGSEDDVYYTKIDGDILDTALSDNPDETQSYSRHYFPSDTYYGYRTGLTTEDNVAHPNEWANYAALKYVDYGSHLLYNYDDYWTKTVRQTTSANNVTVSWRKTTDYAMVKLMVEVNENGTWVPMAVTGTTDELESEGEAHDVSFTYSYKSYKVAQNPETQQYSVIATSNIVKTFAVSNALAGADLNGNEKVVNPNAGTVRYINFQFIDSAADDTSGQTLIEYNDDIRVTALFTTVTANVKAEENVYIDDGKAEESLVINSSQSAGGSSESTEPSSEAVSESSSEETSEAASDEPVVSDNSAYMPLYQAESYRDVDNFDKEFIDKKAVLFGDTLIFRKKLQNAGKYNANDVVIAQDIPKGLTLDESSIGIYKQLKTTTDAGVEFGPLINVNAEKVPSMTDFENINYKDEKNVYTFEYYDNNESSEGRISWRLNPLRRDYDYYVYYKAKVKENYKLKEESFGSQADFGYVFINGTVGDNYPVDSFNTEYAEKSIFKISAIEDSYGSGTGTMSYTVRVNRQQANDNGIIYEIAALYIEVPTAYAITNVSITESGVENPGLKIADNVQTGDNAVRFEPSGDSYYELKNGEITVTYEINLIEGYTIPDEIKTSVTLTYYQNSDTQTVYQNDLTKIISSTNEVQADARWLYLNVEKTISENDPDQSFLFKVTNTGLSENNIIYSDFCCPNPITSGSAEETAASGYKGSRLIQITKRGQYCVEETDWAYTDYNTDNTTYSFTDISFPKGSDGGYLLEPKEATDNTVFLPRAMYSSTAFPLWAVERLTSAAGAETQNAILLAANEETGASAASNTDSTEIISPTISAGADESPYAWLSAQTHTTNSFN